MNAEECRQMFLSVAARMIDSEKMLTEIDEKIGDGDHGTGMALGFRNVKKELEQLGEVSIEEIFKTVGMTLLDTMGGASGVLFGTVFISGISPCDPHFEMELDGFAKIFRKSLDALKRRGKAKTGDKTMVDALEPAVIALEEGTESGMMIAEGFRSAALAAKKGMEKTKEYKAKFGRAKYFGDNAVGYQDAGATSVWIIFQEMSDWVNAHG